MLTTFFKSELLSCLQKVLSCDQLMQKPYHYKKPLSNISDKCDKLGNFSIKTVQNLLVQNYNFFRSSLFFVHLYCQTRCLQTVGFPFTIFFRFEQMLMFHMCNSLENCSNSPEYGFMCNYRRGIRSDFDFVSYVKDLSTHVLATAKVTNGFSPLKWNETC